MGDNQINYGVAQLVEPSALDREVEGSSPSAVAKPRKNRSIVWKISDIEFVNLWNTCQTMREVLKYFKLENKGGNYRTAIKRAAQLKLDIKKFNYNSGNVKNLIAYRLKTTYPLNHWLQSNVRYAGYRTKKALLATGRPHICELCSQEPTWNNIPLTLQIDHKDGNSFNNTPENIRFICPNCHSQTSNFAGRKLRVLTPTSAKKIYDKRQPRPKRRKVERPTKEELIGLVQKNSFLSLGRKFGVSDNAIRKWCKSYNIPLEPRLRRKQNFG